MTPRPVPTLEAHRLGTRSEDSRARIKTERKPVGLHSCCHRKFSSRKRRENMRLVDQLNLQTAPERLRRNDVEAQALRPWEPVLPARVFRAGFLVRSLP